MSPASAFRRPPDDAERVDRITVTLAPPIQRGQSLPQGNPGGPGPRMARPERCRRATRTRPRPPVATHLPSAEHEAEKLLGSIVYKRSGTTVRAARSWRASTSSSRWSFRPGPRRSSRTASILAVFRGRSLGRTATSSARKCSSRRHSREAQQLQCRRVITLLVSPIGVIERSGRSSACRHSSRGNGA